MSAQEAAKMNMAKMAQLFAAHSPTPETVPLRFKHSYAKNISIATIIRSPENSIPAFEHSHEAYEFLIPVTPVPFLLVENGPFFGEVGYVFPVHSGRSHGVKYSMSDVSHTNIVIEKEFLESILTEKNMVGAQFNYEFPVSDELRTYIRIFYEEFEKGAACDAHKMKHLTSLICLELIDRGTDPHMDTRKAGSQYQKGISSVAQFINDNYQTDISIEELAKMCGFSTGYFTNIFKKALGESPHSYLNKLRISRAKVLLETTNRPISSIAAECGFHKSNSFTSLFKTATGMTPSQYRKTNTDSDSD